MLRAKVAELRPAYVPPDPAPRTVYAAGELVCDLLAIERQLGPPLTSELTAGLGKQG